MEEMNENRIVVEEGKKKEWNEEMENLTNEGMEWSSVE